MVSHQGREAGKNYPRNFSCDKVVWVDVAPITQTNALSGTNRLRLLEMDLKPRSLDWWFARRRFCLPEFDFDVVHEPKTRNQAIRALSPLQMAGADTEPV